MKGTKKTKKLEFSQISFVHYFLNKHDGEFEKERGRDVVLKPKRLRVSST